MTEWAPATEAEAAMRDALRGNDQQLYFRILSSVELLLPISAPAVVGQAPVGWGTWTTGGRTHVLAFTSAEALRACLGDHAGPTRRLGYAELAAGWPNHEWWLAVNPGLPVEGYLPAWYVSQLSRGDVRLPGRTVGARARLERVEALNRARAGGLDGNKPSAPKPSMASAPEQRPGRPGVPPPVVPPAFQLPDVPVAAPGTVAEPHGRQPAGWALRQQAGPPASVAPEHRPVAGATHPAAPADERAAGFGAARPDGRNGLPPRRPVPSPAEQPASPGHGRTIPPERSGAPANGHPADLGADQAARRSFFEPAAGRPTQRGDRLTERATPPSRFARGGQPFPRRGPAAEPSAGQSRAFVFTDDAQSTGATRPAADGDATQPLTPTTGPAPEPFRRAPTTGPAGWGTPGQDGGADDADPTQALPRRPLAEPTEELSPSIAEPVSGPPAPRRGFTPIVIEGTIIEARDLTIVPPAEEYPGTGVGGWLTAESAVATGGAAPTAPAPPSAEAEPTVAIPPFEVEPTVAIPPVEPEPEPDAEATVPVPAVLPEPPARTEVPPVATPEQPPPAVPAVSPPASVPEASSTPVPAADFEPANEVEEDLLAATGTGNTDTFLSTLLLARVLMPVAVGAVPGSRPGDPGFVWPTVELDGQKFVVVYTSPERLADHADPAVETMQVRFVQLIRCWPDPLWSFAVNPGTPVGAKLPGEQIVGLANWATELGLGDDAGREPEPTVEASAPSGGPQRAAPAADPARPIVMQKAIAPSQLGYYLERGYDRVSGFVHRATELAHLTTPAQLFRALGLHHPESPFASDAEEIYVLRWPAYRPSLYRIPYGGQNETAMRAMEGWVIERPPFRGNGFAPGESGEVLAEFKVDSVRLPHGAQLLRLGADGVEHPVAVLDADTLSWRQVGDQ
ncbi:SseB family protein [Micromonospora radicis]|uniref:SseB protein N-terminal domain-containing protein n=1 Tax=Micromonospora radicis TaxID=1894971 RepID=A0A418MR91_9ACTN|nr:SseB family protein [Micromonospora radicis]RIV36182.1 hypothetical protein D2L64_20345 [Micromonospora radicis]